MKTSFGRTSSHLLDGEESERKRLEEASARFIDYSQDLLSISGFDGLIKWVNRAFEPTLGYCEEELVGKPYLDFVHPDDRERVIAEAAKLASTGDTSTGFEARVRSKDGGHRRFLFTATPSTDEELIYSIGKDITERKQLEESTRFMDLSIDLLGIAGFDGYLKRVTPSWSKVFGWSEDEILGRPYLDFIHPDDHEKVIEGIEQLMSGLDITNLELRTQAKDGTYRWFLWSAKPSLGDELFYTVGRDVTDRMWVQEGLRDAEERFRAAFEQAPIGMALVSLEQERPGSFMRVNRALCEITGFSEEQLIGTDFRAIAHPGEIEADLHYVRWMLMGEISQYEIEKRLRHADGHTLWALVTVSLVKDAERRPLYLISQIQDITARKEAERGLWESRERLQDIIDNTTAVICLKDREGRYLLVNDRFEILFGVKREEIVGKTDHDFFPDEMAAALRSHDLKVLATGIALEVEEVAEHEDGTHTYLSTRFPLFHSSDSNGSPYGVCAISTDITERKRTEEALRASEEHFRRIVHTAHVAFVSMDAAGLITSWNPQAEETFGWSQEEAIGRSLARTIIPHRYREAHREGLDRFLASGRGPLLDRTVEIEALHHDGHEFPVEVSITTLRIEGEYVFNAFLHDISERKSAEENLRQLANIVESSGDAIVAVAADSVIRTWNPGAESLYGYSASEAIGESIEILVPSQLRGEEEKILSRVRSGERIEQYETERVRKDGAIVDVSLTVSPIKDAVGTVVGASRISRDITERKRADQALFELQEGFRSAFENAPIGMALFRIGPEDKGRVFEANGSMSAITGHSVAELLGLDLLDLTHPDDLESERPLAEQLLAGQIPNYRIEKRFQRPNGSVVWVNHSASTVHDSSGELLFGVAQIEDITERKRAEERLGKVARELERRAAELERSNADLQQFAYAASHDLSEPLRMVSSYVQLLAKRYKGRLDSDADEFIEFAVDGVVRMQALIDGLLLYSRAGTSEYELELVDCSEVLRTTLLTMQRRILETGAIVTADRLPTVRGDSTQLSQLFQNLISNALKFIADGPPRIHVSAEREGDAWGFSVSDNGIGIEPSHARRIFQVFQRLHGRGEYPGSGIGLAICKRIVERHNGRISVEPNADGGSTFHFTIPDDAGGSDRESSAHSASSNGSGEVEAEERL